MDNSRSRKLLKKYSIMPSKSLWLTTMMFVFCSMSYGGQIGGKNFPDGPDMRRTPGALCESETYRYPSKIRYCKRNVDSKLKNKIITEYDKEFDFDIQKMPRGDFKIDHFIPLSIGGANAEGNLWPQHKTVYKYSDPLESHVANLIATDKISQDEAIRVIKECKLNLDRCADLQHYLEGLY